MHSVTKSECTATVVRAVIIDTIHVSGQKRTVINIVHWGFSVSSAKSGATVKFMLEIKHTQN